MALNFNTLLTVAIENRSTKINDVLTKSNALLSVLRDHGGVKLFDGGRTITENIMFAEPGANAQSYSGYDTLNTLTGEHLTMAEFGIAQYASSVSVSGLELAQNSGKSKLIDLVESRVKASEAALTNKISGDLYGDGTTANSLTGIQAMLPAVATTGVYGGIDRASYTWWRHQTRTGTAITSANIYAKYLELFLSLGRNSTEAPDAILACKDHFFALNTAMQAQQRFEQVGSEKYTNLGFQNLMFMNCPVFLERNAFGASGMISNGSYFLNLDSVKLRPFKADKFVQFDAAITNTDSSTKRMKWYGQLTCNNVALNGVLIG